MVLGIVLPSFGVVNPACHPPRQAVTGIHSLTAYNGPATHETHEGIDSRTGAVRDLRWGAS
jgi:hypothetical protein